MSRKKKTLSVPFLPDKSAVGLPPVALSQDDKKKVLDAVRNAGRRIPVDAENRFIAGIEFAVSAYRAEADVAIAMTKATATKKLNDLRDTTKKLLDALTELDDPTQWLIRSCWVYTDPSEDFPMGSVNELCRLYNVLSAAIAQVNGWPKGRPSDYARKTLACLVAKVLRDSGIEPKLTRNGAFAGTLRVVMDISDPKLKAKGRGKRPDVMDLMRPGLRILNSESSPLEFSIA